MDESRMQFRVGVMLAGTVIMAAILVLVFGHFPVLFGGGHQVKVRFGQVRGVVDGTPVRDRGLLVGRVVGDPTQMPGDGFEVTVRVDAGRDLFPEYQCRIVYSAMGDAHLEFSLPAGKTVSTPVAQDYVFHGQASQEPLEMVASALNDFKDLTASFSDTSKSISGLTRKIDEILEGRGKAGSIVNQSDETLKSIKKTMDSINGLVTDPELREPLRLTLKKTPGLVEDTHSTVLHMEQTLRQIDENMPDIRKFTQALGDRGPATLNRLEDVVKDMDVVMKQLVTFSESLNKRDGTLGQLIHNPELYEHLNSTVTNVDQLVRELRPIISDARTFSDKIARHPEVLGVRGAIKPSPGIK